MIPGLDIILGGVTGLIGNAFTTWFKFKNAKMEYAHKEKMVELETDAMIKESEMNIKITQAKIAGEIELADSEAYKISQATGGKQLFHEKWIDMLMGAGEKSKWFGWLFSLLGSIIAAGFALVDWLNALMRPSLTVYLVGACTYITLLAWRVLETANGGAVSITDAFNIFHQVTSTVIYLTTSAVTWWFGDRTMSKYLQEKGKKK